MKKLIIIPILFISIISSGTKYYVKSTGSDANTGLSDEQAWAHHPWMSTWSGKVILSPGDSVCMKRGDTWSISGPSDPFMMVNQNGSVGRYITTTAYGTGTKPVLSIPTNNQVPVIYGVNRSFIKFDNIEIKHWSKEINTGGWYCGIVLGKDWDISHDWIITNCDIHNCPNMGINAIGDYNIAIGDTSALATATAESYSNNIYDCGCAGVCLGGSDPNTGNSNFNVCFNYIHDINVGGANGENSYGIMFTRNPKYCYARYNFVKNVPTWEGLDCHNGQYMYFQNNYLYNCHNAIATGSNKGSGLTPILDHVYIERNICENPGDDIYTNHYFTGATAEDSTYLANNIYIRDNTYFYTVIPTHESGTHGINIEYVDGVIISGNHFYNGPPSYCNGAIMMNVYEKNVTITNNFIINWTPSISISSSSTQGNININKNIFNSQGVVIGSSGIVQSIQGHINIYNNNIIVTATTTYSQPIRFENTIIPVGSSLKIKNNIIGFTTSYSKSYIYGPSTINGTFESDYNIYWNSIASSPYDIGLTDYSWDSWNKLGYDIHSLYNVDPFFQNYTGSYSQDIDFELQKSSPAIDAGIDVGLTSDYAGNPISGPPDIGAYEYQSQQSVAVPVYVSSSVENATPSSISIVYNLSLASINPATAAFTVNVNSVARTINSVAVAGTTVTLTLASPVVYGDVLTVAYSKPSTNPLQTSAGGQATSFTAQAVTNNVSPPVPVYLSSAIQNATPSKLDMTYSLALGNTIPTATAFSVTVNSAARTVSAVAVSGTIVSLTLASPVAYGDIVTVAYTIPSSNPLQTSAGGQASPFSAQKVTNNVAAIAVPVYVSFAVENATPAILNIVYSLSLANIVPAASAFSVTVNSASRTVSSVSVSGTTVSLTLSSAVAYGDAVTVAYTQPSSNPLQTSAGGQVTSFSAKNVTNNVASVTTVTAPVYVSSSVENATPTKLNIVYSLSLANTVPAASAFSVTVNSASRTVNSVAVSGTTVSLTLASAVAHGDAVTVAYTKPSSNPLQTSAGGQVASFSAQKVTNNVASVTTVTAPVYVSSSVENATPTKLNIVYSLSLANSVPAASAFSVTVNSASRTVNSVAVSGTNVVLTLSSAVIYGDALKLSYTKPSSNPLQTSAGGQAASFSAQTVANNVQLSNSPPVVMVNYESTSYSGFVNELDASGSYDPNKDNLTFSWVVPSNISVSSTTGSVIKYLSPASDATQKVQFVLNVSDGKTTTSKAIPVEINPYEPGLDVAEVAKVEASSYSAPNYPSNIIDGNIGTMWAANGNDQWLLLTLKEEFNVQYVDIAFESGQAKESFFDIMGSDDMNTWETILTKSNSCAFSGALQVFNFPASKTANEFKYIKIVGHGNSTDTWNYISEFRIFGYKHKSPTNYEEQPVKIYPNPASNYFNVRIDETSVVYDFLRIISLTGKVLLQQKIDPGVTEINVAIRLLKGVYLIEIGSENVINFCQKLVVSN